VELKRAQQALKADQDQLKVDQAALVVKGGVTTGERRSLFDAQKDLAAAKKKWETQVGIKKQEDGRGPR